MPKEIKRLDDPGAQTAALLLARLCSVFLTAEGAQWHEFQEAVQAKATRFTLDDGRLGNSDWGRCCQGGEESGEDDGELHFDLIGEFVVGCRE